MSRLFRAAMISYRNHQCWQHPFRLKTYLTPVFAESFHQIHCLGLAGDAPESAWRPQMNPRQQRLVTTDLPLPPTPPSKLEPYHQSSIHVPNHHPHHPHHPQPHHPSHLTTHPHPHLPARPRRHHPKLLHLPHHIPLLLRTRPPLRLPLLPLRLPPGPPRALSPAAAAQHGRNGSTFGTRAILPSARTCAGIPASFDDAMDLT